MAIFLGSAFSVLAGLGVLGVVLTILFGIVCALLPFVIVLQLWSLNDKGTKQISELQRQNILTRQLLRAYGHEPEA
jgi:hypothetical protein